MNFQLIHRYHLVSFFLAILSFFSADDFIQLPPQISSVEVITFFATLLFWISSVKYSQTIKWVGQLSLAILLASTLNTVIYKPTAGLAILVLSALLSVPNSLEKYSYKRLFFSSDLAIMLNFLSVVVFFVLQLTEICQQQEFIFLANVLSISSLIIVSCGKKKINQKIGRHSAIVWALFGCSIILLRLQHFYAYASIFAFVVATLFAGNTLWNSSKVSIERNYDKIFSSPEVILISFFAILAVIGCLMLQLPFTQTGTKVHSVIDSLFTAMSAVCVTGLAIFDTPNDYTFWGQFFLVILIQLGGLGIMSMSAWILVIMQSRRLSVSHENTINELSSYSQSFTAQEILKRIFLYFFGCEAIGAVVLFIAFIQTGASFPDALWNAIFTAVSAFCNAGFALQSDNLVSFQSNFVVINTVALLIIAGGFAPLMVLSLPSKFPRKFSLQDKISLSTTIFLLLSGTFLILALEWSHSLASLNYFDKLLNAWFQSVTTRTAGFNSIDLLQMREITSFVFIVLMFIGGNPGGAAGGIKTVTAATLFFAVLSVIRGEKEIRVFDRTISPETVFKALAIACVGMVTSFIAFVMLCITQKIPAIPLLFETVSAMGTVGLSLGVTPQLDEVGKVIIILCMLAGRVGPITFLLLLTRKSITTKWKLPREEIYVS